MPAPFIGGLIPPCLLIRRGHGATPERMARELSEALEALCADSPLLPLTPSRIGSARGSVWSRREFR